MSTEELIAEVKKHTILYDLANNEYKNIRKKDKVWSSIALQLGINSGKYTQLKQNFKIYYIIVYIYIRL